MENFTKYLAILTALAMLSGCGRLKADHDAAGAPTGGTMNTTTTTPATGTSGTTTPAAGAVRYSDVFNQVLGPKCLSCHGNGGFAGVNVTSRDALVQSGVVVPGNSNQSEIVNAVESGAMPQGGTPLTQGQIALLRNWIDEGATP